MLFLMINALPWKPDAQKGGYKKLGEASLGMRQSQIKRVELGMGMGLQVIMASQVTWQHCSYLPEPIQSAGRDCGA